MASPRRRISDDCAADASSKHHGRKPGVLRAWSDAGLLGISPAHDIGNSIGSSNQETPSNLNEIVILADMIRGPAGQNAILFARELISAHGSFAAVLMAPEEHAKYKIAIPSAVFERLRYFNTLLADPLRDVALSQPIIGTSASLFRYLHTDMAALKRENFRVLFLDCGNHLLLDRVMWEGTVNKVQVHPREVVRVAIETGATALILAHNHPSGRPQPTGDDLRITRQIVAACAPLDIIVHDHLIVACQGVFSMAFAYPEIFSVKP